MLRIRRGDGVGDRRVADEVDVCRPIRMGSGRRSMRGRSPQAIRLTLPSWRAAVWTTSDALDQHLAGGWVEERQHLGDAMTNVFMWVTSRPTDGLPVHAWLGYRLVGASFVHAPHRQTHAFPLGVSLLDQPFFALASGSWTLTSPRLRLRIASPVSHQVRSRCQVMPASCSTAQMVYVLTLGRPSAARRRARCKVFNDQVAVPSRSRSGRRRNSARIRSRSAAPYWVGGRPPTQY